ncbi:MAG: acyltransferase [Deltaproteobacteria bacterium]|jgi:surface polysaccharide O-acyltransferase-like enzyme|nr:acyltransferase [Deltaproteobacteria bacterium]
MEATSPKAPREAGIELGRIFCCFCVILIHLSSFYLSQPDVSWLWSIAKCASTPVFFLIAGFFFNEDKPFTMYMSRITIRVVIPTIFVMLIIAQLTPWLSGQGTWGDVFKGINFHNFLLVGRILITTWPYDYIPGYNPFISLWFSFALFLCYLCIPLLKIICADNPKARRLKHYILALGVIFFVLRVTLLCLFPQSFTFQHLDWWIEQKPFYWLWLMILGHEIAYYWKQPGFADKWKAKIIYPSLITYLLGGTILFFMTMAFNVDDKGLINQLYFNREFFIYLAAQLGMFMFFVCLDPGKGLISKIILFVADKTFYIYIIHEAVYHKLVEVTGITFYSKLNYLGFGVLTFVVCLVISIFLKKIEKTIISYFSTRKVKKAPLESKEDEVKTPS